jgi:hypothetical protein
MPDIPILGQNGHHAAPALQSKKFYIELSATDGGIHVLEIEFNLPVGPDGAVHLDALKGFDPEQAAGQNIIVEIGKARGGNQTMAFKAESGRHVLWHQVVSWQFVGPADEHQLTEDGQLLGRFHMDLDGGE